MENMFFFPGLGLEFHIDPVAFSLFGFDIYWYGIIIAAGFLLAVGFANYQAPKFGVDPDKLLDMLFFAVPLAIIGARLYYVLFELDRFRTPDGSLDWGKAVNIHDGGMAIYGGIIAAVITVVVFCRVRKIKLWNLLDVGAYGLLIGQAVGRWGNFVNVEVFGRVTDVPWRMCGERVANWLWNNGHISDQEVYRAIVDGTLGVHPTFIYESAWNVLGLILLIIVGKRWRKCDGQIFLSYVVWYGAGRAVIEGIRSDTLLFFNTGIRVSQMVAVLSVAAAFALLLWRMKTGGPATTAEELKQKEETPAAEAEEDEPQEESAEAEEGEPQEESVEAEDDETLEGKGR